MRISFLIKYMKCNIFIPGFGAKHINRYNLTDKAKGQCVQAASLKAVVPNHIWSGTIELSVTRLVFKFAGVSFPLEVAECGPFKHLSVNFSYLSKTTFVHNFCE